MRINTSQGYTNLNKNNFHVSKILKTLSLSSYSAKMLWMEHPKNIYKVSERVKEELKKS